MLDQKQAIPFLAPDRERLLEYDISRAIARVMTVGKTDRRSDEFAAGHGRDESDDAMQRGQNGPPPWAFIAELKRDFNVKQVEVDSGQDPR